MEPSPDLDQRVVAADLGSVPAGDPVRLVIGTDDGDCTIAAGVVAADGVRVSLLDAALVRWVALENPVRATSEVVEPCDGLPPVDPLVVPSGGWAVGLRRPATVHDREGPFDVVPIGTDGRWWHIVPEADGVGSLTFDHPDAPPTRFAIRVDERVIGRPSGDPVAVPRGGAAVVPFPGDVAYARVVPQGIVELQAVGAQLVVLGLASGVAEGVIRVGTADPEPLRIEVGGPVAPVRGELVVPAGGHRRVVLERAVVGWWVGARESLDVEVRGRRLILSGGTPGRTQLVLQDDTGVLVTVPIVVGG